jgi:hypothetical protein
MFFDIVAKQYSRVGVRLKPRKKSAEIPLTRQ